MKKTTTIKKQKEVSEDSGDKQKPGKQHKALKQSQEIYQRMVEEIQDYAIILLDTDGTILNWNKGAEKIKGYSEQEIIGKNFRIFYRPEDRQRELPEKLINIALSEGQARHEGWRLRKNGTTFWGSILITTLHNKDGRIIGFSKITRDLTDKKNAEDRMKQYMSELEFQNKELEQFAYIASHDLQEPLRKIQIFSDLIGKNIDNSEVRQKYFTKLNSSTQRMAKLIRDVLNYSRLTRIQDEFEQVDLNVILENVTTDFEILIQEKDARIISGHLPVIRAIPLQLNQLFSNLIHNSLKFNKAFPEIRITATFLTGKAVKSMSFLAPDQKYLELVFADNGIGFDQKFNEQIFAIFQRLHSNDYSGTGIGLALCKKIIENHHGEIKASSIPGQGTTFRIYLPA